VRESYSNIARKLCVDEESVRMRVKRAHQRGFLPAWRVLVNPALLGCEAAVLELEVDDERKKAFAIS
jgi:DNA-binding Lrp family transcriptional regulator